MARYTEAEWNAEGEKLFGPDKDKWAFECPNCKNVMSLERARAEFVELKGSKWLVYQECVGRYSVVAHMAKKVDGKACDWCSYGLFRGPDVVVMPDGKETGVFAFARPTVKSLVVEPLVALTLWRPWDTAIFHLGKPLENRDWPCPPRLIGQRIALHSGKKFDQEGACAIVELAVADGISPKVVEQHLLRAEKLDSVILGTVKIGRCISRAQPRLGSPDPLALSRWFFGKFGWVCEDSFPLPTPVPCRGAQGLWRVPDDIAARVRAQELRR
jgi:hypothetical protein